jgi:DNA mismatch repair protein MutL
MLSAAEQSAFEKGSGSHALAPHGSAGAPAALATGSPDPSHLAERAGTREPVIAVLSPLVASQIAAGEVVERPASIVKELIENAIDAGANKIRLELDRGGIELVRVTDDGCGIAPEQLALAVTPNATSKLRTPQDLLQIATLGFRGEALASIASVSRCTVRSRRAQDTHAYELEAFGTVTQLPAPKPVAGPVGTSISAANLFFNVPARRAFLRTVNTERDRCLEVFDHAALAHPAIAFVCVSDGSTVRDYPAARGPAQRILNVLGEELASQLFTINASTDDFTPTGTTALARRADAAPIATLFGVAGLPAIARGTMKGQHLFINGRPIKDRSIQHAIAEAYRGLIEPGRYPIIVLLIEVDPNLVDVNVHPQKSEVRFRDGGVLHSLVLRAVRDGLAKADLTPAASDMGNSALRSASPTHPLALGEVQGKALFGSAGSGFRHLAWSPFTQSSSAQPSTGAASDRREQSLLGATAPALTGLAPNAHPAGTLTDSKFAEFLATSYEPGEPLPQSLAAGLAQSAASQQAARDPNRALAPLTSTTILHVHDKYVVTLDEAGLVIIDQHALHERVMFEKLLARIARGPLESQPLLTPVPVHASTDEVELVPSLAPLLNRLGLSLLPLSPTTIGVQSLPTLLIERSVDIASFVSDLLSKALKGEFGSFASTSPVERDTPAVTLPAPALQASHEHAIRDILDMMACKAAIKAGDKLSEGELRELLHLRETVERSSNCPHGRPTSMRVTLRELDRLFGRS